MTNKLIVTIFFCLFSFYTPATKAIGDGDEPEQRSPVHRIHRAPVEDVAQRRGIPTTGNPRYIRGTHDDSGEECLICCAAIVGMAAKICFDYLVTSSRP